MKKSLISSSIVILLFVSLTSCKKLIDKIFTGVDANVPEMQITIPIIPIVPPNELSMGSTTTRINLDSIIRANTNGFFGIGIVSSIKVKQIVVSVSNGDNLNNLSNFETARVTLTSPDNNVPVNMANLSFPDATSSSQTFTPADSPELLDYLKGSEVTYTMYGKARRITTKPLHMTIALTLRVK